MIVVGLLDKKKLIRIKAVASDWFVLQMLVAWFYIFKVREKPAPVPYLTCRT